MMINPILVPANFIIPAQLPLPAIIGPESNKHNYFDDLPLLQNNAGFKKIKSIRMYFSEKRIMGIEMIYQLRNGKTLTTTHNPRKDSILAYIVGTVTGNKVQTKTFQIKNGDYIYQIQGTWDKKRISFISFQTYKGDKCYFGIPTGEMRTIKNPGFTFGPVRGSYRHKSMNYFIFPATTIPEQIIPINNFNPYQTMNPNINYNINQFPINENNNNLNNVNMKNVKINNENKEQRKGKQFGMSNIVIGEPVFSGESGKIKGKQVVNKNYNYPDEADMNNKFLYPNLE